MRNLGEQKSVSYATHFFYSRALRLQTIVLRLETILRLYEKSGQ